MTFPDIAIVNFSTTVSDAEAQTAIRAVNRQVREDFSPIWGSRYECRLHASPFDASTPGVLQNDPIQAEAVIYLVDQANIQGALGYHDMNAAEVPVGFVFTDLGDWTVTLSHEVLELIVDPTVNIFVPGPDPRAPQDDSRMLWHAYEVCDAVERTTYRIDGIEVSNFVTPQYFADGDAPGTRNDFLGVGVVSFGLTPGSHVAGFDPIAGQWVTVYGHQVARDFSPGSAALRRFEAFDRKKERPRCGDATEAELSRYQSSPARADGGLHQLTGFKRSVRKEFASARLLRSGNDDQDSVQQRSM